MTVFHSHDCQAYGMWGQDSPGTAAGFLCSQKSHGRNRLRAEAGQICFVRQRRRSPEDGGMRLCRIGRDCRADRKKR